MESLSSALELAQREANRKKTEELAQESARRAADTRWWEPAAIERAVEEIWSGASEETQQKCVDFVSFMEDKNVPVEGYYKPLSQIAHKNIYTRNPYAWKTEEEPTLMGWLAFPSYHESSYMDYDYGYDVPGVFVSEDGRAYACRRSPSQIEGEARIIAWEPERFAMPDPIALDGHNRTELIVQNLKGRGLL